eukprot:gene9409-11146_t
MSKQEREIEELAQKIKAMAASKPTSFSHSTTREVSISAHPQSDKGSPAAAPRRIGCPADREPETRVCETW